MDQLLRHLLSDSWLNHWLEKSEEMALVFDERLTVVYTSSAWKALPASVSIHHPALTAFVHKEDAALMQNAAKQLLQDKQHDPILFRVNSKQGILWLQARLFVLEETGARTLGALTAVDITSLKREADSLRHLAYYDPLTGLPNRRLFEDRLQQAMRLADRYLHQVAILYLDLDDFKQVNDQHGHHVGDLLLKAVAARLHHSLREPDSICRMGGDEFVILLQHCENPQVVRSIAARMIGALNQTFDLNGRKFFVTCSMGGAIYPKQASDAASLLEKADAAMYASKLAGKNCFELGGDA